MKKCELPTVIERKQLYSDILVDSITINLLDVRTAENLFRRALCVENEERSVIALDEVVWDYVNFVCLRADIDVGMNQSRTSRDLVWRRR